MRTGYFKFETEREALAFMEGITYVNDGSIEVSLETSGKGYPEVKLEDRDKEPCPYCQSENCCFNGLYTCDGSLGNIDNLE